MTGQGSQAFWPSLESSSADGRYLRYVTGHCAAPADAVLRLRNLPTGRELTWPITSPPEAVPGLVGAGVFTDNDREVVSASGDEVGVLRLPSLTGNTYATAPRGCRYGSLAGTGSDLFATLDCGAQDALSVVAISPRTFAVTRTLIRLGTCVDGSISAAVHDPSALLVETEGTCLPPTAVPKEQILKVRGAKAHVVLSGSASYMPTWAIW